MYIFVVKYHKSNAHYSEHLLKFSIIKIFKKSTNFQMFSKKTCFWNFLFFKKKNIFFRDFWKARVLANCTGNSVGRFSSFFVILRVPKKSSKWTPKPMFLNKTNLGKNAQNTKKYNKKIFLNKCRDERRLKVMEKLYFRIKIIFWRFLFFS